MTPEVPIGNLGLLLMIAGGGWLAVTNSGALLKWFRSRRTAVSAPGDDGHNSDAAPPMGFTTHVDIILLAAPSAPAGTLVAYCEEGLTEAQVLVKERIRLEALVGDAAE
tara:strand:+ start:249 stop:575 length:327 start_codon:yes stop_codon:yes gene_type:complete